MPFQIALDRPSMTVALFDSLIAVRFGQTTIADLDDLVRLQGDVVKRHGHFSMLGLVEIGNTAVKVSDEVKAKSLEMTKVHGKHSRGSATVIMGTGLGAAVIRTFMTGFNLMSKSPFPTKTFSNPTEGLTWLSSTPNQSDDVKKVSADDAVRVLKMSAQAKAA